MHASKEPSQSEPSIPRRVSPLRSKVRAGVPRQSSGIIELSQICSTLLLYRAVQTRAGKNLGFKEKFLGV